jgi:hypothetical protein
VADTLTALSDLANNPAFVRKVTAASVKAAVSIGNEVYDGSAYRILRRSLATKVLNDSEAWGRVFTWAIATNSQMTAETSDTDIEWTIGTVWDAVAGAFQTDPDPAE